MELGNATTDRYPRKQFTGVKWFCQIIIRAGCESFDDLIFFGIAREQDDVSIRIVIATDLLTEL